MKAKRALVITTINATLAFVVMMTTVTPGPSVDVTNVQAEESPAVRIPSDARAEKWLKFQRLAKDWQAQRSIRSSITSIAMMPAYQSIIGMGDDAIPLIIARLRSEGDDPDQWFWALKHITQEDPVDPQDRGDFSKMARTWIRWAEDEGYAG
jgi:hypothetical protein